MKNNLKNLFILRSPLQIINALDAIEHFNLENNIVVPVYNRSDSNTQQMKKLLSLGKWEQIIHIEESFKSKFFRYVKIIRALKKHNYKNIFIGELGIFYKIVVANTKKEKVFLLDDGTVTMKYYNKFIIHDKYNKYNFRELRFLFAGLKIKVRDKVNLYTYFDLKPVHGIEVVKNNLNYLKRKYLKDAKKDTSVIYFIGQPLDDVNVIDVQMYKKVLENIIKMYQKKIVYIPHRSESEKLKQTIASIDNPLFEVNNLNKSIEMYLLEEKIYPMHIMSFSSTALTTLGMVYEDSQINVIKIPENSNNKEYFDNFLREYYNSTDQSKIITFKDLGIIK
ncbi:polysialyltransferase family glycosyltransferase [Sulfurimonas sp.]|uniref:polysialyltransferase family glycosyltransferase n=1 Tax=Sulfurimonas sp. TaxID=2022749 RepID=UPI002629FAF8|nr:polysialyltransferase family glycosyltransferase [Sulfurimonas sp.]MCW8896092.1 alpha-2,8-polysialyltransferase family protein [Sulfurimonas sp.]